MTLPNTPTGEHPDATSARANQIASLICDADAAMDVLTSTRREVCTEYNERVRKLRDLKASLHDARGGAGGEMFDVAALLSPELKRLLADPAHSL